MGWIGPIIFIGFIWALRDLKKGEYKKVLPCFEQAAKLYKEFADAKYYMALCHAKLMNEQMAHVLLLQAEADLTAGHSFNEDSNFYEEYPYQVKAHWIRNKLRR